MRWTFCVCSLCLLSGLARAEMVMNDSIGNDPAKETLCAERAKKILPGKMVPFEIDTRYLASVRSNHPDAVFISIQGQLIQCHLRQGTGRYEPNTLSPEQWFWRTIKPKGFEPGIRTDVGRSMAARACLEAAPSKINRPNFDHSVYSSVEELHEPRELIGGKKAASYDIAVRGFAFYKSSGPDLVAVKVTCLFSPMLELKAFQFK